MWPSRMTRRHTERQGTVARQHVSTSEATATALISGGQQPSGQRLAASSCFHA